MKARVSLGLSKMSVSKKIEVGREITTAVAARREFANSIPPLADVINAVDELQAAYDAAKMGGHFQTAVMRAKEKQFDNLLSRLAAYVEIVANEDESLIRAAGMNVRGKGKRPPQQFSIRPGHSEGDVVLTSQVTPRASYVWQKVADLTRDRSVPDIEGKWEQFAVTTQASATASHLTPGVRYWFRVAAVTSAGQGSWSEPISFIVQ
jgi:hypothetical protein